jgi:hypothetical protein
MVLKKRLQEIVVCKDTEWLSIFLAVLMGQTAPTRGLDVP